MKNMIDQSGLVAGSDYLSLSRTMVLDENYLVDRVTNARHRLHGKAVKAMRLLELPIPYELWQQYIRKQNLNQQEMLEILLFLNSIGALEISRSMTGHKQVIRNGLGRLIKGVGPTLQTKRVSTNFASICKAILLAMRPLVVVVLITTTLAYAADLESGDTLIIFTTSFLASIWVSTVAHEVTHCLAISRSCREQVLLRRGMRIGILHKALPVKTEITSAVLGPIVGAIASLLYCLSLGNVLGRESQLMAVGLLVACLQLTSFLPFYGDGKTIWSNIKTRRILV